MRRDVDICERRGHLLAIRMVTVGYEISVGAPVDRLTDGPQTEMHVVVGEQLEHSYSGRGEHQVRQGSTVGGDDQLCLAETVDLLLDAQFPGIDPYEPPSLELRPECRLLHVTTGVGLVPPGQVEPRGSALGDGGCR